MSMSNEVFERDAALDAQAFALQGAFRVLLDCMARPGEVGWLEADSSVCADARRAGVLPATLMLADVLLDAGTTAAVVSDAGGARARFIARRTHVTLAAPDVAAYLVIPEAARGEDSEQAVASCTFGTLEDPHRGATCIVECATLLGKNRTGERMGSVSSAHERSCWELSGPGIKHVNRLELDRGEVMRARAARADEFPCGIDLVFVDGAGHVAAVPRTTGATEVVAWDM